LLNDEKIRCTNKRFLRGNDEVQEFQPVVRFVTVKARFAAQQSILERRIQTNMPLVPFRCVSMSSARRDWRGRATHTCPSGRPVAEDWHACAVCGEEPIHGARGLDYTNARCTCSFTRAGRRLCRACAVVYDLAHHGGSQIRMTDWDPVDLVYRARLVP
jgi:hypothetical protein